MQGNNNRIQIQIRTFFLAGLIAGIIFGITFFLFLNRLNKKGRWFVALKLQRHQYDEPSSGFDNADVIS